MRFNYKTYNVTSISNKAFYGNNNITTVIIPEDITRIDDFAFNGCINLTDITIQNAHTYIGNGAFDETGWYNNHADGILYLDNICIGYKGNSPTGAITLKDGTRRIYDNAFKNCHGITSVTIPNTVVSIGDNAFSSCYGLTSVTIGNSVTEIGDYAFYYCTGLTSMTIGNSVTKIGDYAFFQCNGLTSVTIPNSVTSIGDHAFSSCYGLTSVTIGNSVTEIGDYAFYYCQSLTEVTIGNSVTEIGEWAFNACNNLTSLTIGNSVTKIGNFAFANCWNLTSVTIPNSVTSIGIDAFAICKGLTSVTIPNSVTEIHYSTFYGCDALGSIIVADDNPKYDSRDNCNAIIETETNTLVVVCKNTIIPNSVTSIGESAFWGCRWLKKITIPASVTSIGESAFGSCTGLVNVNFANSGSGISLTSIGNYAFNNCTGLTAIEIPHSVTSIGNNAFSSCSGLTAIEIPHSVTSIGEYAFGNCKNLSLVLYQADNCATMGSSSKPVFNRCENLKTIWVGSSVEKIPNYAFKGCTNLEKVISLRTLTIPSCESCEVLDSAVYTNAKLYVPQDAFAKYYIDDTWGQFSNISKIDKLIRSLRFDIAEVVVGDSTKITPIIYPENASLTDLYWKSNNPSVATVDQSGVVTGVSKGYTSISAYTLDGSNFEQSFWIYVEGFEVNINASDPIILAPGESCWLNYYIEPSYVTNSSITWGISNPEIISLTTETDNSAVIEGITDGKAYITVSTNDGTNVSDTCQVIVSSVAVKISLSDYEIKLPVNDIVQLKYYISPSAIANNTVTWSTSNANVAPIKINNDGSVTIVGLADGVATISATANDGSFVSASCKVTVGVGGIEGVETNDNAVEVARYDVHGRLLSAPAKGINIVKYSDGTVKKIIIN